MQPVSPSKLPAVQCGAGPHSSPTLLPAGALLLQRAVLTNLATGESAAFHCGEWLRSSDPFDLELDAGADEQARKVQRSCVLT